MHGTFEAFCRKYSVCQSNKGSTKKQPGLLQPLKNPDALFQHINIDFMTHLPVSTRGYDAAFSFVDRLSRLVRFVSIHTSSSA